MGPGPWPFLFSSFFQLLSHVLSRSVCGVAIDSDAGKLSKRQKNCFVGPCSDTQIGLYHNQLSIHWETGVMWCFGYEHTHTHCVWTHTMCVIFSAVVALTSYLHIWKKCMSETLLLQNLANQLQRHNIERHSKPSINEMNSYTRDTGQKHVKWLID